MNAGIGRLATLLHEHAGITFNPSQLPGLARSLARAAPGMSPDRMVAEADRSPRGLALLARLVDEVTVKETYFYRAPLELEAVPWRALWDAARARGESRVSVWVSACATGEEAYTLAILAYEAFGGPPPVAILATDISDAALDRARAAEYTSRSVARLPVPLRDRYLTDHGRHHTVCQAITELVEFRRHNLIADPVPGAFDVIACRNVLIYFDAETVERVTAALERAVVPGGSLILGAADRLPTTARTLARAAAGQVVPPRRRPPAPSRGRSPLPTPLTVTTAPVAPPAALAAALVAADAGDLPEAIRLTGRILDTDPLDADAHFVRGLAKLGADEPADAVLSLRRALYLDPTFGLAAFQLGSAYDALGDERAATRAYEQALAVLPTAEDRHRGFLGQLGLDDVVAACRVRLLAR